MITRVRHLVTASIGVTLIVLVLGVFHSSRVADAHAILEASSPSDGSVLAGSPARVLLTFSEAVTIVPGSLRVFDSARKRVDTGVVKHAASNTQITVGLKPDLPVGSYAVAWRVISADTHPVQGGYVFSVRKAGTTAGLNDLLSPSSQPGWEAVGAVLRGIGYLGSFVVVGAAVFVAFVRRRPVAGSGIVAFLNGATIVTILAQAGQVPVSAALATGEGPGSLFSEGVLPQVLGQGVALTLAGVALATIAGLTACLRTGPERKWAAVLSVVLVAVAFAASGHGRSTQPTWLATLLDATHVAAGAVWMGGVVMLAWSLRSRRNSLPPADPEAAAAEVVGFSRVAMVTIVVVAAAGFVLAYLEIRSLHGLVSTAYGRLVLAKIGLLGVLGALGAFNHFRLLPGLRARPDHRARWRYLRTTVRIEALTFVAVLGVTGVLVNAVPARNAVAARAVYSATADLGKGSINLVIDPARTGPAALHVYILDREGRPDDDERSVEVQLTQPALDIGPVTQNLHRAGPGHFVTNGTLFTVPGEWKVTMRVRVDEFTENAAVLSVKIAS